MSIKVFNSLTRKKEDFRPAAPPRVTMYVCGPTVYSMSHIGHARSAVAFDAVYRYLKFKGYDVVYSRNYTDVDDKIIARAKEEGITPEEVARKYIAEFDSDMAALGVQIPTHRPKATETMDRIIEVTKSLIDRGFAYESGGDVFFAVRKFEGYGKLSGKNIDELESGARVSVDERKSDPLDFALWKASKPGEPAWESPWGPGRPGWHIECSAMCLEWLGKSIDIHGGGKDLIFPHHENEIAQSEAATGSAPFVRYWLHNGFVNIEREKMSKSIGNILNIRDALEASSAEAIRLFLLSSHYRSPIDYSAESLRESEAAVERIYKTLERIDETAGGGTEPDDEAVAERMRPFIDAMDDDFNTAEAIGVLFKEVSRANKLIDESGKVPSVEADGELMLIRAVVTRASTILGVFGRSPAEYFNARRADAALPPEEIERLIEERNAARKDKDFARADAIRAELLDKGVVLEDTAKGTVWTVR